MVTTRIGIQDAAHCAGIHLNMPIVPPDPATMADLTEREKSALAGMQHYQEWDSGYSKQQSTRPQTLGYGLVDSPAGQAAWILEKFWAWTDCDGHPENVLSARRAARQRDALLAAGHGRLVGAAVLGELPHARTSIRCAVPVGLQHLPEGDLPHLAALGREALRRTSSTGTSSRRAATSRPSSSPSCSSTRCAPASARCARA